MTASPFLGYSCTPTSNVRVPKRIDDLYRELNVLLDRRDTGNWNDELSHRMDTLFTELRIEQRREAVRMKVRLEAVLHLPIDATELLDEADQLLRDFTATSD
jgi:hypothetical protein